MFKLEIPSQPKKSGVRLEGLDALLFHRRVLLGERRDLRGWIKRYEWEPEKVQSVVDKQQRLQRSIKRLKQKRKKVYNDYS